MNKPSAKIKILYVDDEFFNLHLFKDMFKKDFEVYLASSGMEALEGLDAEQEIRYLLSDLSMPEMDGLELIKQVKTIFPKIICGLLTGYDKNSEIENAISDGLISRYFSKPMDPAEIRNFFSAGN